MITANLAREAAGGSPTRLPFEQESKMALEVSELINVEVLQPAPAADHLVQGSQPEPSQQSRTYTGLAVRDADRWIAVAPELGTVAEGASAAEALTRLEAAVHDILEIAAEEGVPAGRSLGNDELAELILEHRRQSTAPVTMRSLIIRA